MFLFLFRRDGKFRLKSKKHKELYTHENTRADSTLVALVDVPQYLRGGFLYESYCGNEYDDVTYGKFEVPINCFKKNTTVTSTQDLRQLCQSVRYWIVEFPRNNTNLFRFSFSKKNRESVCEVCSQFQNEIPYIRNFRAVLEVSREKMVTKAAELGMLDVLQFLHKELALPWCSSACAAAASNGHIACLIYLHKNDCPWDQSTLQLAGANGHLACLKYAQSRGCPHKGSVVVSGAVENGHLECVKFMIEQGWYTPDGLYDICAEAAATGNVQVLAYFLSAEVGPHEEVCHSAATHGQLPCLEYAFNYGCPLNRSAYLAAQAGHCDCLEFALNNQHPASPHAQSQICNIAVHRGFTECLKVAHARGCPISKYTMLLAVRHDRMECVEYLHGQNCPWDADVTAMAALHGRLACLQYLHEQGCPWDARTIKEAVTQSCLLYAQSHGCPGASN